MLGVIGMPQSQCGRVFMCVPVMRVQVMGFRTLGLLSLGVLVSLLQLVIILHPKP